MTRAGNEGPRSCHSARGEGQKAPTTTMVFSFVESASFQQEERSCAHAEKRIAAAKVLLVGKIWEEGEEEFAN